MSDSPLLRIPAPLRSFTNGQDHLNVRGASLGELLDHLREECPDLHSRICDEQGLPRPFVRFFVGETDVDTLGGRAAAIQPTDVVSILPAVAGGRPALSLQGRLQRLRQDIPEVTPQEAFDSVRQGIPLIDVREPDEVRQGSPEGALRLGRGFLELRVEDALPEKGGPVLLLCAGGVRSLFAAESLRQLGYSDTRSVVGGFTRWKAEGVPFEVPRVLEQAERERYGRHLLMPEVGEAGQLRLLESKVLLVGAGGLGSPAAYYLAAAGVGQLTILDDDVVDRSNLQRQILHSDARVGLPKVESAKDTLSALNPSIQIHAKAERLTATNVEELLRDHDVVVDGSDNFPTRYLVNDACVQLGIPNVHGSVFRFEGQVSVFDPAAGGPCYRCLYPEPPPPGFAPSCAEAGVLGVLPGVIGTLEAVETLKVLLGTGKPLIGRVLHVDTLGPTFRTFPISRNAQCPICSEGAEFEGYVDYAQSCSVKV